MNNCFFLSFDIGEAHFIAFSTEFYFFVQYGFEQIATQWNWLIQDLQVNLKFIKSCKKNF